MKLRSSSVLLVVASAVVGALSCADRHNPLQATAPDTPVLTKPGKGKAATTWRVPGDFATIQDAIDDPAVQDGHTVRVGPGAFAGATVTKSVTILGVGQALINDGPVLANRPCGLDPNPLKLGFFFAGGGTGSGSTVSLLRFEVAFPVFSRGADNVTVTHNTMVNPVQGVSNWSGSGWDISHNQIDGLFSVNGGGIGILVADASGGVFGENLVSHNSISGVLTSYPCEQGGYDGSGIVLYADWRYGRSGTASMTENRVVQNTVSLTSGSLLVGVNAFELSQVGQSGPVTDPIVITDNAIGFNDFRETETQILLTPSALADVNEISRNLGDNRGQGLHPKLFGPGGN